MDIEEIHAILKGASDSSGSNFDVTLRWFKECGIVDEKTITTSMYIKSYERLAPNREDLTLTNLICLLGKYTLLTTIFARETRTNIEEYSDKFETVKDVIIEEIQENIRNKENEMLSSYSSTIFSLSEESLIKKRIKFTHDH
ncbi:uncharacterized protein LOC126379071 [Pectinophora gossypiella]|uniref:uncharacterized protein LOC126379071 n=1 Tax=Pectinophora gossypiella TaxID=13191 RepID=UPI00214E8C0D|nr:uncharacterized protein LOC126379071 [Pectinophora gossypiella]